MLNVQIIQHDARVTCYWCHQLLGNHAKEFCFPSSQSSVGTEHDSEVCRQSKWNRKANTYKQKSTQKTQIQAWTPKQNHTRETNASISSCTWTNGSRSQRITMFFPIAQTAFCKHDSTRIVETTRPNRNNTHIQTDTAKQTQKHEHSIVRADCKTVQVTERTTWRKANTNRLPEECAWGRKEGKKGPFHRLDRSRARRQRPSTHVDQTKEMAFLGSGDREAHSS